MGGMLPRLGSNAWVSLDSEMGTLMKYRIEIEVSPEVSDLPGLSGTIGYNFKS